MALLDISGQSMVRAPGGGNIKIVAFRGVTAANGDITLSAGSDYDGAFTAPGRSTNTYTVNIGSFKTLLSCIWITGLASVTYSTTFNPSAGTVTVVFGSTLNAVSIDVIIVVDRGSE